MTDPSLTTTTTSEWQNSTPRRSKERVGEEGEMAEVHSSTLGRKKSRIPTAKQSRVARSVSDTDLTGTDSVDERLETLLHLLGGARQAGGRSGSQTGLLSPEVMGGPGGERDTLQYLSQLEQVARKLKHQLIKQKQVRY